MKYRYIGEAPEGGTIAFGDIWRAGEVRDVTDPDVLAKMATNRFFQAADEGPQGVEPEAKRRPGRPPKAPTVAA